MPMPSRLRAQHSCSLLPLPLNLVWTQSNSLPYCCGPSPVSWNDAANEVAGVVGTDCCADGAKRDTEVSALGDTFVDIVGDAVVVMVGVHSQPFWREKKGVNLLINNKK